jgi:hypothetical protein
MARWYSLHSSKRDFFVNRLGSPGQFYTSATEQQRIDQHTHKTETDMTDLMTS